MEKVKGGEATKPEDFKESFLNIAKMLGVHTPEELDRIVKACEEQGNYTGLINQTFGAMAKKYAQMHARQDELFGTALPILTGLASAKHNPAAENVNEGLADDAIALAKIFLEKLKAEEGETKK